MALADADGDGRWAARAAALLDAVGTHVVGLDGVVPGYDDGGDGGLFNGILARYLADAALRRPEFAPRPRGSCSRAPRPPGRAAWRSAAARCSPRTGAAPPAPPRPGRAEAADLSVQLSAWMLLEAAAAVQRAG